MIVTLTGENDVLRDGALRELTQQYDTIAVERLDGEEVNYARINEAAQSVSLLAPSKLVVLRMPSANKDFTAQFEQFIENVAADVVIVEPKPDKRTAYYKQLQKLTEFQEFKTLDGAGLAQHLSVYAKEQDGTLSSADARFLVERVGSNQQLLLHEVDKLLAYAPAITRKNIELLTDQALQSSTFDLIDAAFSGNAKHALKLYDEQRAARVEPQQIIALLAWQLSALAVVKAAGTRGADTIAREAKMSPYTVNKTMKLARTISLDQLKTLVRNLRQIDERLKSEALNADEALRYYLLSI